MQIDEAMIPMAQMQGWLAPVVDLLESIAVIIDLIGIAIILYGFVISLISFVRAEIARFGDVDAILACQSVRLQLGTYILLGIEFMIASDIVHTVISREIDALIFVAALVVIRTAISFFLGRELAEAQQKGAAE